MNLLFFFKEYLLTREQQPSKATVKNYLADVRKFILWFEEKYQRAFEADAVTPKMISLYKDEKLARIRRGNVSSATFSVSSVDRYLSSLRKFFNCLKENGIISSSPFDMPVEANNTVERDEYFLKAFKNHLLSNNIATLTIKNYIIDIRQFLNWATQVTHAGPSYIVNQDALLTKIDGTMIEEYKIRLLHEAQLSPVSINRKLSAIRKYLTYAYDERLIHQIPLVSQNIVDDSKTSPLPLSNHAFEEQNIAFSQPDEEKEVFSPVKERIYSKFPPLRLMQKLGVLSGLVLDAAMIAPIVIGAQKMQYLFWIATGSKIFSTIGSQALDSLAKEEVALLQKDPITKFIGNVSNFKKSFYAPYQISTAGLPLHRKIMHHMRHNRPQWYKKYHSYPIVHYMHFAALIIFMSAIGFGIYRSYFLNVQAEQPVLAAAVSPPRILSFQGRLTDSTDNPITANTNLRFAIYNNQTASGSALLWQEVQNVTPDKDGIFSVILGENSGIPQSVFGQNAALFLGIAIGRDAELIPRQQIASVAYATNAELLQGMPAITQANAGTNNVILALDSSGNLSIGGTASPTFQATGGTFTLAGKVLQLATTNGSNGNIVISPDGSGTIDLQKVLQNTSNNGNLIPGAVEVNDLFAVMATSSGQAALTVDQNGSSDIIKASVNGATQFAVGNSGSGYFAGNVGIGELSPSSKLYIESNSDSSVVSLNTTASSTTLFNFMASETQFAALKKNSSGDVEWTTTGDYIFTPSGNIGIGTTVPEDFKLQVSGDIGPNVDSVYSLGSDELKWDSIYVNNLYSGMTGINGFFNRSSGAVNLVNTTDDFLVGGNATASAKINLNGTSGVLTTSGGVTIGASGSLVFNSMTNVGGILYLNGSGAAAQTNTGSTGQCLLSAGTDSPVWGSCIAGDSTNYWTGTGGTLYTINSGLDLLIGGTSTASAEFAFINTGQGNPTASIAGNLTLSSTNGNNPSANINVLNGGTLNFQTSNGGTTGLTSRLFINSNGNIGIGTTTPNAMLDINGQASISGDLKFAGGRSIQATENNTLTIGGDTTGNIVIEDTVDLGSALNGINVTTNGVISDINGNLILNDTVDLGSDTTGVRITTTGAISDIDGSISIQDDIEVTGSASVSGNLNVTGLMRTSQALVISGTGPGGGYPAGNNWYQYQDSSGDFRLARDGWDPVVQVNRSTNNLTYQGGGNVGIGTTDPIQHLVISGATSRTSRITETTNNYTIDQSVSATGPMINFGDLDSAADSFMKFGAYNGTNNIDTKARNFRLFSTADSTGFTFQHSDGNVGIGSTAPSEKLQLSSGNLRLDRGQHIAFGALAGESTDYANIKVTQDAADQTNMRFRVGDVSDANDGFVFERGATSGGSGTELMRLRTTGALELGSGSGVTGSLVLENASNNNTVTLNTGTTASSFTLTLPTTQGTTGQCLKLSNSSGQLAYQDCSSTTAINQAMPVGSIVATARATAPDGWIFASGSAVSRTTYAELFAAIGTTFGAGDGSTTFNLPDLRGRIPLGADGTAGRIVVASDTLGSSGGEERHLLTAAESGLPAHGHDYYDGDQYYTVSATFIQRGTGGNSVVDNITNNYTNAAVNRSTNANTAADASTSHNIMNPYQVVNWMVRVSNTAPGADVAEIFYTNDDTIDAGTIVAMDPNLEAGTKKTTTAYEQNVLGIVSTKPGLLLGDDTNSGRPINIGLTGRVPVKVTTANGQIKPGDPIAPSQIAGVGMKATKASYIVGRAMQVYDNSDPNQIGKIMVVISRAWVDPELAITDTGNVSIIENSDKTFSVKQDDTTIDRIGVFKETVIGKIRAGMIDATQLSAESITVAGMSLRDYIVQVISQTNTDPQIISPIDGKLAVNVLTPIGEPEISLNLDKSEISVKNKTGQKVAGIDNAGNATFSGSLTANSINTNELNLSPEALAKLKDKLGTTATESATSVTNITNIYTIASESAITASPIPTPTASPSATPTPTISNTQSATQGNQTNMQSDYIPIASMSGVLGYVPSLKADFAQFTEGLMSLGPASLNDVSVAGQLSVNGNMILASNSINVMGADLEIQPLRQGNVSFMSGLVKIDIDGNLTVGGNATFAKNVSIKGLLSANVISPIPDQDLVIQLPEMRSVDQYGNITIRQSDLIVKNASGSGVLKINQLGDIIASGSGSFRELASEAFKIVRGAQADTSITETVATASAGTATINTNQLERTIYSPYVKEDSLIYITPMSKSNGLTPYVARQTAENPKEGIKGSFTIQVSEQSSLDIKINWWIIN